MKIRKLRTKKFYNIGPWLRKFLTDKFKNVLNKLECSTLAGLSSRVQCLRVYPRVEHLKCGSLG
jgi:hypothetical protein